ncbi:MAG: 3-hydroxyacyl-CoA dehydrogenase family protein [Desulfatiglans sp.]|nr:3-hydroxyacyl-CoA dehydrogenase family protein [Desulfatiglans sp.]
MTDNLKLEDIKKIAVIGAGTMGHGIAQAFAYAGYQVNMMSRTQETLDRAMSLIKASLEAMAGAGLVDKAKIADALSRITTCTNLEEAAKDVDIAFETMAENKDAKTKVFADLDKALPKRALIASNTTFLNPFELAKTSRQDKILIAHFYAPPQIIPLVDVVKGPETDMANVELMVELLRKMGKKPILFKKYVSGYAISRLQLALQREVYYLIDEGYLSPREVDDACIWGLAMRMMIVGAVGRIDFGGIGLSVNNLKNPACNATPVDYKPKKIFELFDQGHVGIKTGKGFYDYGGKSEAELCSIRDEKLLKMLKFAMDLGDALPTK